MIDHALPVRLASIREHRTSTGPGKSYEIVAPAVRVVRVDDLVPWATRYCPGLLDCLVDVQHVQGDVHP